MTRAIHGPRAPRRALYIFAVSTLLQAAAVVPSPAQQIVTGHFTFQTIDPPGAVSTDGAELDKQGRFWGYYVRPDGTNQGFSYKDGVFTPFIVDGQLTTAVAGVSDKGHVVGDVEDDNLVRRGFFYDGEELVLVHPADSEITEILGVNEKGQASGWYRDTGGTRHGFLFAEGALTLIDFPAAGAGGTRASDINRKGDITGFYFDDDFVPHGFVLIDGEFTTIDFPGGSGTFLGGLSKDSKRVTGTYLDSDFVFRGFILEEDGTFVTLDVPSSGGTLAVRFSSQGGKVTGSYVDANDPDVRHGFIATPVVDDDEDSDSDSDSD